LALWGKRKPEAAVVTLDPPAPPPAPGEAPPDPLGLPDFLARMRIGDREAIGEALLAGVARRMGLAPAVMRALVDVERAGRSGFGADLLPTIRFEPHIFSRLTRHKFDHAHPDFSYPHRDERKYPASQELHWRQLASAYALDGEAALRATRWGAFLIAGNDFPDCGFPTAAAFAAYCAGSEARQLELLETLLTRRELAPLLRGRKWKDFARAYCGPAAAAAKARQLERAYKDNVKRAPARV